MAIVIEYQGKTKDTPLQCHTNMCIEVKIESQLQSNYLT